MILEDFESLGAKQTKIKVLQTTFASLLFRPSRDNKARIYCWKIKGGGCNCEWNHVWTTEETWENWDSIIGGRKTFSLFLNVSSLFLSIRSTRLPHKKVVLPPCTPRGRVSFELRQIDRLRREEFIRLYDLIIFTIDIINALQVANHWRHISQRLWATENLLRFFNFWESFE